MVRRYPRGPFRASSGFASRAIARVYGDSGTILAMPLYRVQFEFNMDTGNPLDKTMNTVHVIADDVGELESGAIVAFTTFYGTLDGYFSKLVLPEASVYRAYDLDDPEPRAPVLEEVFDVGTTGTGDALPPELAVVVSFEAPQQSGEPQARRRGRLYFGPLDNVLNGTTGQIGTAVVDDFVNALDTLLTTNAAATTWAWAVYSRANDSAIEVTHGWVDNAFDIQRRRGLAPTYTVDVP